MSLRHSVFVSYRRRDTAFAVDQLDQALKKAVGSETVFRDLRSIRKGMDFPGDIRAALSDARVGLIVIGPWWLAADKDGKRRLDDPADWVRIEVETLLRQERNGNPIPVIPIFTGGAQLPSASDLPESLKPLTTRDGLKLDSYPDAEHSIQKIIAHIADILGITLLPETQTSVSVQIPVRTGGNCFTVTGKMFVGRERELHLLDEAWERSKEDKINVISFLGQGGEGKSALVLEWESRRARNGWPGTRRVYEWSFYSQGASNQSGVSTDEFLNDALSWFGHTGDVPKDSRSKGLRLAELVASERTLLVLDGLEPLQHPPGSGFDGKFKDPAMKALLIALAKSNPGLCILTSRVDITDLASFEEEGRPCVRHALLELDQTTAKQLLRELGVEGSDHELDEVINWFNGHAYDLNLLGNFLGQCTTDHNIRGWQQRFAILEEDEQIHPILDAHGKRAGHGVRMLRAYVDWLGPTSPATSILRLLGLFDRPARSDLLDELRAKPAILSLTNAIVDLPDAEWQRAVSQLERIGLITCRKLLMAGGLIRATRGAVLPSDIPDEALQQQTQNPNLPSHLRSLSAQELRQVYADYLTEHRNQTVADAARERRPVSFVVDAHPLLREYFAKELKSNREMWQSAHRRIYAYLSETTPDNFQGNRALNPHKSSN